jgi:hypothetical protein
VTESKPVVHILRHGFPFCGFSDEVPKDWPPGHTWISFDDALEGDEALRVAAFVCQPCLSALEGARP